MRKPNAVLLLIIAALAGARAADAQTCLGLPSFEGRAVHLNLAAEFPDSATSYAVGVGAGRPNNLFANLGGAQVTYDGMDSKSTLGFVEFGYQLPLGRLQFCPIAGAYFGTGPDDGAISVTSRGALAGLSVGLPITVSVLSIVPNAAVKYDYLSQEVEEAEIGKATESSTAGTLDLGLGLVFRNRIAVQPILHVPFHGDYDKTSFGLFAAVSFGWPLK